METQIAYRCVADCTLESTNFEYDEIIEIPRQDVPNNWLGTEFFDNHPYEFEKVFLSQTFIIPSGDKDLYDIRIIGEEQDFLDEYKQQTKWKSFYEFCEMEKEIIHNY